MKKDNACQIDRLFAIWQALNWEKWWDGTEPDHVDPHDNRHTLLQPFHLKDNDPEKQVYTADLTRDWNKLGYSDDVLKETAAVEDVVNTADGTLKEEAFKSALRAKLGTLYPSAPTEGGLDKKLAPIPTRSAKMEDIEWFSGNPERATWNDYIINVDYDRYAGGGSSYSVEFFLGGPRAADATDNFHPLN
ncbi:tyrosinase precursor [Colletotrichum sp. SAR 10_77]|nr:tyrosinase precursor [Colletotrichum sp. SAR 10_77]